MPLRQQRNKKAGPARRESLHATGSGAGDITTTPASSPPPPVAAPAAILTERCRCVHLEAGRRVPSDRPEEPPTVRICLQDVGEDRFLISPVGRVGPGLSGG